MYQDLDLVTTIRKSRLKLLYHVHRMSSQRGPKMALEGNSGGRRRKGRPRKRWIDDVQDDMIKMGVKRWRTKAMDRGEWRKIYAAAKVLQELYSHGEKEEVSTRLWFLPWARVFAARILGSRVRIPLEAQIHARICTVLY
jgi:hypothetical protein